jgi:hypothetical protein
VGVAFLHMGFKLPKSGPSSFWSQPHTQGTKEKYFNCCSHVYYSIQYIAPDVNQVKVAWNEQEVAKHRCKTDSFNI